MANTNTALSPDKDTAAFGAKTITQQAVRKGDKMAYAVREDGMLFVRWDGPTGMRQWLKDWDKRAAAKKGGLGKRTARA